MTSKIVVNNIEADSGINTITFINEVTAPTFNGNIVGTAATFATLNITGDLDVGGALTYEDVTNVDSIGVITARNGIVISEDDAIHFRGTVADDADAILRASAGGGQLLINSRNDTIINIDSNNDSTDAHFAIGHGAATGSSTELFRVQENGKIGIGQADPQGDLHIGNISGNKDLIMHSANNGTARIRFREGGSLSSGFNEYSFGMVGSGNAMTVNGQGAGEIIRIMGDTGLVGVNCTPLTRFQVKAGTNQNIALTSDGSEAAVEAYNDAGSANVPLRIRGSEIKFKIDGTQRARLSYSSSSAVFSLGDESNSAGHLRFEAKAAENQIHGRSNHPITFLINTGEKLKLHTTGLLEGKGAQFTANVTPSSGRGVEIFEAGTGVGQISSYNRDGNGWDELRIKGSEVKVYAGTTNTLTLNLQSTQSTLYGTSDGIFNLDTTDGRGSFIRFKENGNTKAWVGCAEGMGGGTHSPDQDDLGLRAVGNILFSTNGSERLRINENGEIEVRGDAFITINEASPSGNFFQEIAYAPNTKGCLYLENFAYYGSQPALVINDQDTNNARVMEDVQFQRNGTMRGYIRINPSNVTYSTSGSDRRLKKNFEDWTEDNLSKFKTLSPKLFNWIEDEDGTEKTKGFIAQDNLDKFPEAYDLTVSTDRYYFNPSGMVHYMMKALQEAATKIETMEARIAALEGS